jgi:DNA-directed RNA polymerase beta subunit
LEFVSFELGEPKIDEYGAKEQKMTYDAPLKATIRLTNKMAGTKKEQPIFLADFPIMTEHGTFIINGVERVIVPQLARSFGVFFSAGEMRGKVCFGAKIIPRSFACSAHHLTAISSLFLSAFPEGKLQYKRPLRRIPQRPLSRDI